MIILDQFPIERQSHAMCPPRLMVVPAADASFYASSRTSRTDFNILDLQSS